MPRTARASVGGVCYHVLNRGNGRQGVFHDDADYQSFLDLLADAHRRLPLPVLGFCLMPNHFHLVLWPTRIKGTFYFRNKGDILLFSEK